MVVEIGYVVIARKNTLDVLLQKGAMDVGILTIIKLGNLGNSLISFQENVSFVHQLIL